MIKSILIILSLTLAQFTLADSRPATKATVNCNYGKDIETVTFVIDLKNSKVDTLPRKEDVGIMHVAKGTWHVIGHDLDIIPDVTRYDENDFKDMTLSLKGSDADDTAYRVNIYFGIQKNPKVRSTFTVHPFDDSRKMSTYSAQNCSIKY